MDARRDFLTLHLPIGFALAVQPIAAQTAITTDAKGLNAGYRESYRKADAEDAWKRTLAWFKKHGVA